MSKKQLDLDRDLMIEDLVNDDMDITSQADGQAYLYNILKSGFIGYDKMTTADLADELHERIDVTVEEFEEKYKKGGVKNEEEI